MEELSGKWVGFYEYGLGYSLPYFGKRVGYSIELSFENGNIFGVTSEVPSNYSVDFQANIKGFIEDG